MLISNFFIFWLIPGRVHAYERTFFIKICFSKRINFVDMYTISLGGPYYPTHSYFLM
jgi:hypothetical protein